MHHHAIDEVVVRSPDLDVEAMGHAWFGHPVSMRWVLIHMIEETARHVGHADILREQLYGATGE